MTWRAIQPLSVGNDEVHRDGLVRDTPRAAEAAVPVVGARPSPRAAGLPPLAAHRIGLWTAPVHERSESALAARLPRRAVGGGLEEISARAVRRAAPHHPVLVLPGPRPSLGVFSTSAVFPTLGVFSSIATAAPRFTGVSPDARGRASPPMEEHASRATATAPTARTLTTIPTRRCDASPCRDQRPTRRSPRGRSHIIHTNTGDDGMPRGI